MVCSQRLLLENYTCATIGGVGGGVGTASAAAANGCGLTSDTSAVAAAFLSPRRQRRLKAEAVSSRWTVASSSSCHAARSGEQG